MEHNNNVKIVNGILGRENTGHDEVAVTNDMKLLHNTMKYKHTKNETENKKIKMVVQVEKNTDPRDDALTSEDSVHEEDTFSNTVSRPNESATPSLENENIENGIMNRKGTARGEDKELLYFVTNHFHCLSCHSNLF